MPKTDVWAPFKDMIGNGSMPIYGWRIVGYMNPAGEMWIEWRTEGDPPINETVAAMERVKFMSQLQALAGEEEDDS